MCARAPYLLSPPVALSAYWSVKRIPNNPKLAQLTLRQYILGGLRISNRSTYGTELALLASIILAGSSIPRAIKSGKPLPIGLSVLATFGLWTFGNAFMNRNRTV